jgi:hypothetical protein
VSRDANECTRAGVQRAAQAGMQTPEILKRVLSRVHGVADKVHDIVQPLHAARSQSMTMITMFIYRQNCLRWQQHHIHHLHRHAKCSAPLLRNQLQRCGRASEAQPRHQRRDNTCMPRNHAITQLIKTKELYRIVCERGVVITVLSALVQENLARQCSYVCRR